MTHWMTRYDPDDGEPYGILCGCDMGADHDGADNLMSPKGDGRTEVQEKADDSRWIHEGMRLAFPASDGRTDAEADA